MHVIAPSIFFSTRLGDCNRCYCYSSCAAELHILVHGATNPCFWTTWFEAIAKRRQYFCALSYVLSSSFFTLLKIRSGCRKLSHATIYPVLLCCLLLKHYVSICSAKQNVLLETYIGCTWHATPSDMAMKTDFYNFEPLLRNRFRQRYMQITYPTHLQNT